jgi:L-threonylcarbamoyladenylate synthase
MTRALADAFWPGPLTLILPRTNQASDLVTGGGTKGLRAVASRRPRVACRLGEGVAAPSANRARPHPPTTAAHGPRSGDAVTLILDGGASEVGIESTIIADRAPDAAGGIQSRTSNACCVSRCSIQRRAPRAPGTLAAH